MILHHSVLEALITDRGMAFTMYLIQAFLRYSQTNNRETTANHCLPSTDQWPHRVAQQDCRRHAGHVSQRRPQNVGCHPSVRDLCIQHDRARDHADVAIKVGQRKDPGIDARRHAANRS